MPNIILKDRDGNDVTYPDVNAIEVKTDDGLTQIFNCGEPGSGEVAESDTKAFVKVVTLNQTTSNYSTAVTVATADELEAAGIVLDRKMPEYTAGSDIAYISIVRHGSDSIATGKIYSSYVTNIVQCKVSNKYRNYGTIYYYSSMIRDISASGSGAVTLYPVTYGASNAGVEVTNTGNIQVKSKNSGYLFTGTYVLTVFYKKGSQTS